MCPLEMCEHCTVFPLAIPYSPVDRFNYLGLLLVGSNTCAFSVWVTKLVIPFSPGSRKQRKACDDS